MTKPDGSAYEIGVSGAEPHVMERITGYFDEWSLEKESWTFDVLEDGALYGMPDGSVAVGYPVGDGRVVTRRGWVDDSESARIMSVKDYRDDEAVLHRLWTEAQPGGVGMHSVQSSLDRLRSGFRTVMDAKEERRRRAEVVTVQTAAPRRRPGKHRLR